MSKDRISVDFNFKFKGLDGKEISGAGPASEVIANMLYNGKTDGDRKVRNVNWALELMKSGLLDLNPKEMDDILAVCDAGQLKDGYYISVQTLFDQKREEWRALQKKEESKGKK